MKYEISVHLLFCPFKAVLKKVVYDRNYFVSFAKVFSNYLKPPVRDSIFIESQNFLLLDIWILTAGLNTRVTRLFGEIIRTDPDPSRRIHLLVSLWQKFLLSKSRSGYCLMGMCIKCRSTRYSRWKCYLFSYEKRWKRSSTIGSESHTFCFHWWWK